MPIHVVVALLPEMDATSVSVTVQALETANRVATAVLARTRPFRVTLGSVRGAAVRCGPGPFRLPTVRLARLRPDIVVVPGTAPTISGTVTFSDFDGTIPSSGTFEIRDATNSTLLSTQTVAITGGAYTLDAPGNGNYIVSYKGGFWLRKNVAVNTTGGNATGANLVLTNGDLNDDNEIGIGDFGILSALYGSENAAGDINGDGSVDIADYAILSSNYGDAGDE